MEKFSTKMILSMLMVMALLMSMALTGCGGSQNAGNSADVSVSSQTQSQTSADANLVGNVYKTGTRIVKDPITVKMVVKRGPSMKQAPQNMEMWKILEKDTGIKFELTEIPEASYQEKVSLLIATQSIPDVLTESIQDVVNKYYNSGVFIPLNDLIDQWAPSMKKILEDRAIYQSVKSPDDKLYVTPQAEQAPWLDISDQLFVNKVWLDKLGLAVPTTTDEYFEVLKAFKERDPNGNGKKDEIPLSLEMAFEGNKALYFACPFGASLGFGGNYGLDYVKDKKYSFGPTLDAFRKGMEYLNKLYAAGLYDKESFTQKSPQLQAKGNGQDQILGSFIQFWPQAYVPETQYKDYVPVPALKGPDGWNSWPGNKQTAAPGWSISSACRNPEAVIRFIDYVNEDSIRKAEINYSVPSVQAYFLKKDGKYFLDETAIPNGMIGEEFARTNALRWMAPFFISSKETEDFRIVDGVAGYKLELVQFYKPFVKDEMLTSSHFSQLSQDEMQECVSIMNDMKPLIENFISKSIMTGVTDATWTKFQDDLKKAKLDRLSHLRQKSLDVYYK